MTRAILQFLALGVVLFSLERWCTRATPLPRVAAAGAEDALLLCEALGDRVDRDDPVVQRRLRQDMTFLELDTSRDAGTEAVTLDLPGTDLVVRRRLVERMRARLQGEPSEPTEIELRQYLAEHAAELAVPPLLRITQVFVRRDRPQALERAQGLLDRLRRGAPHTGLGDTMPWPSSLPLKTSAALTALFGADFATDLQRLPPGEWGGPISSPYGLHLVRVDEHIPAHAAVFESLRPRLRAALLAERRDANLALGLDRLRANPAAHCSPSSETRVRSSSHEGTGEKG